MDIKEFRHPEELRYLDELQKNMVFQEDARKYYCEYTEKVKIPDLLGKTVEITKYQFPNIYEMVEQLCRILEMQIPQMYVYEDFYYGIDSYGISTKWMEISAKTIADLKREELMFLFAKELASIKLDHTEYKGLIDTMLETMDGKAKFMTKDFIKEPYQAIVYRWMRVSHYTTDRIGYLVCGNMKDAINSILITILNNRMLSEAVNVKEYIKQADKITRLQDEIYNKTKLDEKVPYGPYRIKQLLAFAQSQEGMKCSKLFERSELEC